MQENRLNNQSGHVQTTIKATEFKARCLQLLDEVQRDGVELVISKRGRVVARVIPEMSPKPWLALKGKGSFTGDPFQPVITDVEIEALR